MKTWVKQLREEADHVEDVIDEYRSRVAQNAIDKHGFLNKIGRRIKALKSRYLIASQIRDINESLLRIKGVGQAYGLSQFLGIQNTAGKTTYENTTCD